MRRFTLIVLSVIALALPVAGEVQTYEDEFVSFQYDDEINGFIDRYCMDDVILYDFENDDKYCGIKIAFTEKGIDELRTLASSGRIVYETLLDNGDVFAIVSYDVDAQSDFWNLVSESATLKDGCDFEKKVPTVALYKHYPYSEQAINYARKALSICDSYLSFDIDGKEAGRQIEEVAARAKSYADSTEDAGDSDVYYTVSFEEMNFRLGSDDKIMSLKRELEMILSNAE